MNNLQEVFFDCKSNKLRITRKNTQKTYKINTPHKIKRADAICRILDTPRTHPLRFAKAFDGFHYSWGWSILFRYCEHDNPDNVW